MWYRTFIASNIIFFLGIFIFFTGDYLLPSLAAVTLPAGAFLSGTAGLVGAVSGLVLIWTPDVRG